MQCRHVWHFSIHSAERRTTLRDCRVHLTSIGLGERGGRAVIVENKPGASGSIAVDALKRSIPDSSTLLLVPVIVPVIAPIVLKNVN